MTNNTKSDPQREADEESILSSNGSSHQLLCDPSLDESQTISSAVFGKAEIYAYKKKVFNEVLLHLFGLLTLGCLYLICYWQPSWKVYLICRKSRLKDASHILLSLPDEPMQVCKVTTETVSDAFPTDYKIVSNSGSETGSQNDRSSLLNHERSEDDSTYRYFEFMKIKFIWRPSLEVFEPLTSLSANTTLNDILTKYQGLSSQEQSDRLQMFGANKIVVQVKSYLTLLVTEVFNPFYVFQILAIILWSLDDYYLYGLCVSVISCVSIVFELRETRQQSERLSAMVAMNQDATIEVLQKQLPSESAVTVTKSVEELVPGDVVALPQGGCLLHCDCVLILGTAIVNESMLTGESVPVTKVAVSSADGEPHTEYDAEKHKKNTLFCGTQLIQTRYYGGVNVLAVVVRTGFNTAKGELVRSILFPKPMLFQFYQDSMKFIGGLFMISLIGMTYSVVLFYIRELSLETIIIRTLDLVTIVVPPALPAAMSVGTYHAHQRLKHKSIYCISPPRINVAGKVKLVCFDKTGTITEDSLEVSGVVTVNKSGGSLLLNDAINDVSNLSHSSTVMTSLAVCHDLTYVDEKLIGDPMDIKMFEATNWVLEEPTESYQTLMQTVIRPPTIVPTEQSDSTQSNPTHPDEGTDLPTGKGGRDANEKEEQLSVDGAEGVTATDTKEVLKDTAADGGDYSSVVLSPVQLLAMERNRELMETHFQVPNEYGVLRVFGFNSSVQRMSVVVRQIAKPHMELYCKGAPEVIIRLSQPSTVPRNVEAVLESYTARGYRVLALAHRELPAKLAWKSVQKASREKMECELTFVGLLILKNPVKEMSKDSIEKLRAANIRTLMITGDNVLTGVSVARECSMILPDETVYQLTVSPQTPDSNAVMSAVPVRNYEEDGSGLLSHHIDMSEDTFTNYHLAVDGRSWNLLQKHFPQYVPKVACRGVVFGRMAPDQKAELVETLMGLDYVTGFCGDGANDCAALKSAHVGVSLSEAEASVAAPFTSTVADISCIPPLLREGRAALTTNFGVFKFMALYSLIQFVTVLLLYKRYTNLSDPMFLFIDLGIVTLLAIFMGYTGPSDVLVAQRPLSSLLGLRTLLSLFVQILLVIAGQFLALSFLEHQMWFTPNIPSESSGAGDVSWESTVLFLVSSFQYLAVVLIFSHGKPFRQPFYKNWQLSSTFALFFTATVLMTVMPGPWCDWMLLENELQPMWKFRATLLMMAAFHFILGTYLEEWILSSSAVKRFLQFIRRKTEPKNAYRRVLKGLNYDHSFPPISKEIVAIDFS